MEGTYINITNTDYYGALQVLTKYVDTYNKKEAKNNPDIYISNYGLKIYLYSANKGFTLLGKKVKVINNNISLLSELKDICRQEKYPPAIYVIRDLQQYIPEQKEIQAKIFDLLRENFMSLFEGGYKIVFLGNISFLPNDIRDLVLAYDFTNEILQIKKSISKKGLNKSALRLDIEKLFDTTKVLQKNNELLEEVDLKDIEIGYVGGISKLLKIISDNEIIKKKRKDLAIRNLLIIGEAGTGKTLSSKIIAKKLNQKLYRVNMGNIFNSYLGVTEERVRKLWREIEAVSPAVVLFDEVEKMLAGVGSSNETDAGTTARVLSEMLYHLQERKYNGTLIIGTAIDKDKLPPDFFRLGRWDNIYTINTSKESYAENVTKSIIYKYTKEVMNTKQVINFVKQHKLCCKTGSYIDHLIKNKIKNLILSNKEITLDNLIEGS